MAARALASTLFGRDQSPKGSSRSGTNALGIRVERKSIQSEFSAESSDRAAISVNLSAISAGFPRRHCGATRRDLAKRLTSVESQDLPLSAEDPSFPSPIQTQQFTTAKSFRPSRCDGVRQLYSKFDLLVSRSPVMPERALPEPWLRANRPGRSIRTACRDSCSRTGDRRFEAMVCRLDELELHARPNEIASVAFHLKHIARSTDRLLTYAEGHALSQHQLSELGTEMDGSGTLESIWARTRPQPDRSSGTGPTFRFRLAA